MRHTHASSACVLRNLCVGCKRSKAAFGYIFRWYCYLQNSRGHSLNYSIFSEIGNCFSLQSKHLFSLSFTQYSSTVQEYVIILGPHKKAQMYVLVFLISIPFPPQSHLRRVGWSYRLRIPFPTRRPPRPRRRRSRFRASFSHKIQPSQTAFASAAASSSCATEAKRNGSENACRTDPDPHYDE